MKKLFFLSALSVLGLAAPPTHSNDPASVHGMLVVGHQKVFLSHLPMFHRPHDYQVILEVDLGETFSTYLKDTEAHPEEYYTLEPEKFVLPDKVVKKTPFKAVLYRGHFERGGIPIAEEFSVKILKVIHFKKFAATNKPEKFQGILFGTLDELFLAHDIVKAPDFDQIIQVGSMLHNPIVDGPVFLDIENQLLKPGLTVRGTQGFTEGPTPVTLKIGKTRYLETGELEN